MKKNKRQDAHNAQKNSAFANQPKITASKIIDDFSTPALTSFRPHPALVLFIAAILIIISYGSSLGGKFVYDDKPMIRTFELVKNIANVPKAFTSPTNMYGNTNYYRPIQTVTSMVDYYVWGDDPSGFHISNIIFHLLAVVSVFFLIDLLFGSRVYAVLVTIFFSIHPVHSSVVAYIAGRADSILCFFMLSSFYYYVKYKYRSGKTLSLIISIVLFVLALLTKELAMILPFFIIFFDNFLYRWTSLKKERGSFLSILPFFLILAAYVWFRVTYMSFYAANAIKPFPFYNRLITAPYVLLQYLRLIILPNDLHIERLQWVGRSLVEDKILLSVIGFSALSGVICFFRNKAKVLFFGFIWFLFFIFPNLNIISPLFSTIAENWLYIPSIGLLLMLSYCLVKMYTLFEKSSLASYAVIAGVLAFVCSLVLITSTHNKAWHDEIALSENTIKFNPYAFKMYNNAGVSYLAKNDLGTAEKYFKKCLEIKPDTGMAYFNLWRLYNAKGKQDEAKKYLAEARRLDPDVDIVLRRMNAR